MQRRVAITGLGIITAIGQNKQEFWNNCLEGKTKVSQIPEHWLIFGDFHSRIWSPLPNVDFSRYGISRLETKQLDHSSLIALACAFQALDSAGLEYTQVDKKRNTYAVESVHPERCGVFMGTGIGGLGSFASSFSFQALNRQKESLAKVIADMEQNPAIEPLKEATRRDPEFALAWARLAQAYVNLGYDDRAREAGEMGLSRVLKDLERVTGADRSFVRATSERGKRLLCSVEILVVVDRHTGAFTGKSCGDRPPDSPGSACYQRNLVR